MWSRKILIKPEQWFDRLLNWSFDIPNFRVTRFCDIELEILSPEHIENSSLFFAGCVPITNTKDYKIAIFCNDKNKCQTPIELIIKPYTSVKGDIMTKKFDCVICDKPIALVDQVEDEETGQMRHNDCVYTLSEWYKTNSEEVSKFYKKLLNELGAKFTFSLDEEQLYISVEGKEYLRFTFRKNNT